MFVFDQPQCLYVIMTKRRREGEGDEEEEDEVKKIKLPLIEISCLYNLFFWNILTVLSLPLESFRYLFDFTAINSLVQLTCIFSYLKAFHGRIDYWNSDRVSCQSWLQFLSLTRLFGFWKCNYMEWVTTLLLDYFLILFVPSVCTRPWPTLIIRGCVKIFERIFFREELKCLLWLKSRSIGITLFPEYRLKSYWQFIILSCPL